MPITPLMRPPPASPTSTSATARLVRSKSGLKVVSDCEKLWALQEPQWIKDQEVMSCIGCSTKFDFIKRRHHCRRCGKIFCGKCCGHRVQLHRMGFVDPVRLCKDCAETTNAEQDFFDNKLKILIEGAPFLVVSSLSISQQRHLYNCKLASDERRLLVETHESAANSAGAERIDPIDLAKVITADVNDAVGGPTSFSLRFLLPLSNSELELHLEAPPEPSRKPSMAWIEAFQQGMRMAFESREASDDDVIGA